MTIKEFEIQLALGSLTYSMSAELAYNFDTPKEILTILFTDGDWLIRHWILNNPNYTSKEKEYEKTPTNN